MSDGAKDMRGEVQNTRSVSWERLRGSYWIRFAEEHRGKAYSTKDAFDDAFEMGAQLADSAVLTAAFKLHDLLAEETPEWALHAWRSPHGAVSISPSDQQYEAYQALNDLTIALARVQRLARESALKVS